MHRCFLVLHFLVLFAINSWSQAFQDVAPSLGINSLSQSSMWGNGVSFYDVDEDGWDDVTICNSNTSTLYYHNTHTGFELAGVFFNSGDAKACLWFDMEEDGDNDLLVTRSNMTAQLFQNDGAFNFTDVSSNLIYNFAAPMTPWGASVVDVNRDGFLDIYICNYGTLGAKNTYLQNNGLGVFNEITTLPITSKVRFSFQSTWLDLNQDGYQDLFVINDHNQGNEYYEYDPVLNGFVDKSEITGLVAQTSAMSNSWCDYDRDGDLDMYISNTIIGNRLLRNNGNNVFTDVAAQESVVLNKWSWSALWFDRENDGWDDLVVATNNLAYNETVNNFFFKNVNGHFVSDVCGGMSNTVYEAFVYAKGDMNNDFKTDVLVNPNTNEFFKLLQNNLGNLNHSVKFHFVGRWSNRNAVGVRYQFWSGGVKRMGNVISGENYLSQNSQNISHGLGANTLIDSLQVFWPSGLMDTYYSLPADTLIQVVEGQTLDQFHFSKSKLCPVNDSVAVSLTYPWNQQLWGDTLAINQVVMHHPQPIQVSVKAPFGKWTSLNTVLNEFATPIVTINSVPPSCKSLHNGIISVTCLLDTNTIPTVVLETANAGAGMYYYDIPFGEGCLATDSVYLDEPPLMTYTSAVSSPTCYGSSDGSIVLSINGGTEPYAGTATNDWLIPQVSGGVHEGVISDANGCTLLWNVEVPQPAPIQLLLETPEWICAGQVPLANYSAFGGTGMYSWTGIGQNGELQLGENLIGVVDENYCVHDTLVVVEEVIAPQWTSTVTNASCFGTGSIDLLITGNYGPYQISWNTGDTTFYLSGLSAGYYQSTITDTFGCTYSAEFDLIFDNLNEQDSSNWIWNTTASGIVFAGNTVCPRVEVYDLSGKLIQKHTYVSKGYSIQLPSSGVYILVNGKWSSKVVWIE